MIFHIITLTNKLPRLQKNLEGSHKMKKIIAVLIGLVSAIVGTWFAFFNPGIGVVMSVSIIGAAIIYLLSNGKDR